MSDKLSLWLGAGEMLGAALEKVREIRADVPTEIVSRAEVDLGANSAPLSVRIEIIIRTQPKAKIEGQT